MLGRVMKRREEKSFVNDELHIKEMLLLATAEKVMVVVKVYKKTDAFVGVCAKCYFRR